MNYDHYEIEICTDCVLFHANGDLDNAPGDLTECIEATLEREGPGAWIVVGSGEGFFRARATCDSCGSRLGGNFFDAVLMIPTEK